MKRPTFSETVDVLVKAYLNDALVQGHPCGCGCGNIIAAANGIKILDVDIEETTARWENDSIGSGFDWYQHLYPGKVMRGNPDNGVKQIESTGYSKIEFIRIERAFEDVRVMPDGTYKEGTEDSMFLGLMAVVDVLADIHNVDLSIKESAKLQFVKP